MTTTLTRGEFRGSLEVGAELDPYSSLPDPHHWCDLVTRAEEAFQLARRRIAGGRTPLAPQVFRWPKENGDWRHMIWMDPIDQAIYRGSVGRLVLGIQKELQPAAIASSILKAHPPRWQFEHHTKQTAERREMADELFAQSQGLGVLDIKNFYPSVSLDRLPGADKVGDLGQPFLPRQRRAGPQYLLETVRSRRGVGDGQPVSWYECCCCFGHLGGKSEGDGAVQQCVPRRVSRSRRRDANSARRKPPTQKGPGVLISRWSDPRNRELRQQTAVQDTCRQTCAQVPSRSRLGCSPTSKGPA